MTAVARDAAHNYFVTAADVAAGRPRARAVLDTLLEMNDDCHGEWRAEAPAALLAREPGFLRGGGFSLVIACQMPMHELAALAALMAGTGVPLLVRLSSAEGAGRGARRGDDKPPPPQTARLHTALTPPPPSPSPRPCAPTACSQVCGSSSRSTT